MTKKNARITKFIIAIYITKNIKKLIVQQKPINSNYENPFFFLFNGLQINNQLKRDVTFVL